MQFIYNYSVETKFGEDNTVYVVVEPSAVYHHLNVSQN